MAIRQITDRTVSAPVLLPDSKEDEDLEVAVTVPRCTSATPTVFDDPTCWIDVAVEASFDGGQTWVPAGGFGCWGGVHVRADGNEATFSGITTLYEGHAKDRLLRYTVTPSKPTQADVEVATRMKTKRIDGGAGLR